MRKPLLLRARAPSTRWVQNPTRNLWGGTTTSESTTLFPDLFSRRKAQDYAPPRNLRGHVDNYLPSTFAADFSLGTLWKISYEESHEKMSHLVSFLPEK